MDKVKLAMRKSRTWNINIVMSCQVSMMEDFFAMLRVACVLCKHCIFCVPTKLGKNSLSALQYIEPDTHTSKKWNYSTLDVDCSSKPVKYMDKYYVSISKQPRAKSRTGSK